MPDDKQRELQIRAFEIDDAEPLSRLIVRNLLQVLVRDYSDAAIELMTTHFAPDQLLVEAVDQLTLVCMCDDELVGTAALRHDRVRTVFVDVARHRSGIGRGLMAAIEAEARDRGLKQLYLMAGLSACGFYEKLGYKVVEYIDRDLDGVPMPVIHMEKVLHRGDDSTLR